MRAALPGILGTRTDALSPRLLHVLEASSNGGGKDARTRQRGIAMLPFTVDQFFSVFAACNSAVWPMQVIACLLGAAALWAISVARPWGGSRSCGDPWHPVGVERLAAGPLPIWVVAIPVVWAGIGATAAVLLNVPEDLGLLVAGVLGAAVLPFSAYGRSDHASLEAHP